MINARQINYPRDGVRAGFPVCVTFLIVGAICGIVLSGSVNLSQPLIDGLTEASETTFGLSLWNLSKFHIIALFFAFSALGILLIPSTVALGGFVSSFTASLIMRNFGGAGFRLALSRSLLPALIVLPCLVIFCSLAFEFSLGVTRGAIGALTNRPPDRQTNLGVLLRITIAAAALLLAAVLLDTTAMTALRNSGIAMLK